MDIVGFGALNLDCIYLVDEVPSSLAKPGSERRLLPGEEPALRSFLGRRGRLVLQTGGGSAANTIYAMGKMGLTCGLIGQVGADAAGETIITQLQRVGVDTSQVIRRGATPTCCLLVDRTGERTSIVSAPDAQPVPAQPGWGRYLQLARWLHLSSLVGPTGLAGQEHILEEVDTPMSIDPGTIYAEKGARHLARVLARTSILFCTTHEAKLLVGGSWREAGARLLDLGPDGVLIKRSTAGSTLFRGPGVLDVPACSVTAVDPTGAGDVYAAGFLTGVLLGLSPPTSALLASACAARSVSAYGRQNYPDAPFLARWLAENQCREELRP